MILYKINGKVKSKNPMRICSPSEQRLKHQRNQMFGSAKNLGCGIAGRPKTFSSVDTRETIHVPLGALAAPALPPQHTMVAGD